MNPLDPLKQELNENHGYKIDIPSDNTIVDIVWKAGQLAAFEAVEEAMPPKTDRDVAPDGLSAMWDGGHNSYREEALAAITELKKNIHD